MKITVGMALAATLLWVNCSAQSASSTPRLQKMPEALEMRFALSAAPPHLRENATPYLLDPHKGYAGGHRSGVWRLQNGAD